MNNCIEFFYSFKSNEDERKEKEEKDGNLHRDPEEIVIESLEKVYVNWIHNIMFHVLFLILITLTSFL